MIRVLIVVVCALFAPLSVAEKGAFGFELTIATKGMFSPKLERVVVASVSEGSAAEKAGIVAGDLLVAIEDCEVPGCRVSKARKLMDKQVGESATFKVVKEDGSDGLVTLVAQ